PKPPREIAFLFARQVVQTFPSRSQYRGDVGSALSQAGVEVVYGKVGDLFRPSLDEIGKYSIFPPQRKCGGLLNEYHLREEKSSYNFSFSWCTDECGIAFVGIK
ncbi:hypothetical protein, partial [Chromobacterium violaceum]